MTQQTINIGSGANKGDGDLLRTAFNKINENFIEVYFGPPQYTQVELDSLTPAEGQLVYNTTTGKFQGYAADTGDSTPGWVDLH